MLTMEEVFELVKKENEYAQGWGKGTRKRSKVEGISDADVHAGTSGWNGMPYSIADWKIYTQKYWDEIDLVLSNFTPDGGAVRIRIIKVISMLVRCLQMYGQPSDLQRIAGHSCSEFPILSGGLKTFDKLTTEEGCLIPTADTKNLRNESPSCNPLKQVGE